MPVVSNLQRNDPTNGSRGSALKRPYRAAVEHRALSRINIVVELQPHADIPMAHANRTIDTQPF